jgi:AcrR family transcriptional regulator
MSQIVDDQSPASGAQAPLDDTSQRILQAAAQVFAEKGYARATTRALAAAAGVNEVTLFRHFGTKQNLFAAVIEQFGGPAVNAALQGRLTGDFAQDLRTIGVHLLNLLLERENAMRLMLCEASHFPEVKEVMVQNPRQIRRMLASYIAQQIEQGKLRPLHPEVTAQAFSGMLFSYAIARGMLDDSIVPELSPDELVAQFVDIFVNGAVVRDE